MRTCTGSCRRTSTRKRVTRTLSLLPLRGIRWNRAFAPVIAWCARRTLNSSTVTLSFAARLAGCWSRGLAPLGSLILRSFAHESEEGHRTYAVHVKNRFAVVSETISKSYSQLESGDGAKRGRK